MNLIDALVAEHAVFRAQLDHLEQSLKTSASLERLKAQFELLASGLRRHAKIEDDLVFGPLNSKLGLSHDLHNEHELLEGLLERVHGTDELPEMKALLARIIRSMRRHFSNEETALFPGARRGLGEEELNRLGTQWAGRRHVSVP